MPFANCILYTVTLNTNLYHSIQGLIWPRIQHIFNLTLNVNNFEGIFGVRNILRTLRKKINSFRKEGANFCDEFHWESRQAAAIFAPKTNNQVGIVFQVAVILLAIPCVW